MRYGIGAVFTAAAITLAVAIAQEAYLWFAVLFAGLAISLTWAIVCRWRILSGTLAALFLCAICISGLPESVSPIPIIGWTTVLTIFGALIGLLCDSGSRTHAGEKPPPPALPSA
jgi:hypothetical protein